MCDIKFIRSPLNILEASTKDGNVFRFDHVLSHSINFNNDSKCYEIYFTYYDESNMKDLYSTIIIPLNDLEIITCTSLHNSKG